MTWRECFRSSQVDCCEFLSTTFQRGEFWLVALAAPTSLWGGAVEVNQEMLDGNGDDDDDDHHADHSDDQGGDHHYPSLIMTSLWGSC